MQKKKSGRPKKETVILENSKARKIDSFSAMADEVKLHESYKSLLLGIAVVLLVAALGIGYLKNRNTQNMQTKPPVTAVQITKKVESLGMYTIVPGDDLKTISLKYYETPDLFLTIAKENGIQNPDTIDEGKQLMIPKVAKDHLTPSLVTTASTQPITESSYTIVEGDLLWNIAVRAYGDGYKWKDIMTTNNLQSPDAIFAGMILQLPR
ncbi:MAG: LysM peptidoglycan-binding domain-containing protein [Candidatus Levybacteria bacterium]|nr:LysM peptidoglycan-binding domain-containing protein [Candidatus Levybacteria bacterium]